MKLIFINLTKNYLCSMKSIITSVKNPHIKKLILLYEKSKARKKENKIVIEGVRELQLAIANNYRLTKVFYCPEIISLNTLTKTLESLEKNTYELFEISLSVYKKVAYRTSTEGVIAIANAQSFVLEKLYLNAKNLLLLIAEAPEKPGNIGALLRTADAAKVDAVIIANPKTDMYNPNIIRSSVGCIFTNQIATGTTAEIIAFLKKKNIAIYSAILQQSVPYHTCDFTKPSAIVVGTEATGLSESWRKESTQNIHIPMQGSIDSLNVSVAAGILIFEAKRQRNFIL